MLSRVCAPNQALYSYACSTDLTLTFAQLDASAPPVRAVLLSDIHIERTSYREAEVVRQVNAFSPDLIVLSGDYLNLSRLTDRSRPSSFASSWHSCTRPMPGSCHDLRSCALSSAVHRGMVLLLSAAHRPAEGVEKEEGGFE
jgi:hypothetical protein